MLYCSKGGVDVVKELGNQTETTFRFRWNKKIAEDPRIEWFLKN